ncbi:MAG: ADP/ATP-dependent (S)-NAD(P)H-hydrate dehydratase [Acidimicrobiales bacterium]
MAAFVLGPGLTTDDRSGEQVRALVSGVDQPVVLDAGALDAIATGAERLAGSSERTSCLRDRQALAVLTPHDGEFARLMGDPPGSDRVQAARRAAKAYASVVLLKGPVTVVAHPDGRVLLSNAGDERLATAGSGDVLSGIIGAGLALGLEPFAAAGVGAELHGRAASLGYRRGLVAGDLPELVARVLSSLPSREGGKQ